MAGYPTGIAMDGNTIVSGAVPGRCSLTVGYTIGGATFKSSIAVVVTEPPVPSYPGPYEIVPQGTQRTLPTDGKLMTRNVVVSPIPYLSQANAAGGNTVTIGA